MGRYGASHAAAARTERPAVSGGGPAPTGDRQRSPDRQRLSTSCVFSVFLTATGDGLPQSPSLRPLGVCVRLTAGRGASLPAAAEAVRYRSTGVGGGQGLPPARGQRGTRPAIDAGSGVRRSLAGVRRPSRSLMCPMSDLCRVRA